MRNLVQIAERHPDRVRSVLALLRDDGPVADIPSGSRSPSRAVHRIATPPRSSLGDKKLERQDLRWIEAELDHRISFPDGALSEKQLLDQLMRCEELKDTSGRKLVTSFIERFQKERARKVPPKMPDRFKRFAEVAVSQ